MKILVVETAFLGDALLALPVAENAKRIFPGCELFFLCTPESGAFLKGHPSIDVLLTYDKKGGDGGVGGFFRTMMLLRRERFSMVFSLHRSLRSALLLRFARIPVRFGFDDASGRYLYTHTAKRRDLKHEVDRNLAVFRSLGYEPRSLARELSLYVGAEASSEASRLLKALGDRRLIGIAPGSKWETKRWFPEKYAELATAIAGRDRALVLLGGADDVDLGREIEAGSEARVLNLIGEIGPEASLGVISRLSLLISNDSAPQHMASALGTPVLSLFFATSPEQGFAPRGVPNRCLGAGDLDCKPCGPHGGTACRMGTDACRKAISVDEVSTAVESLLREVDEGMVTDEILRPETFFRVIRGHKSLCLVSEDFSEDLGDAAKMDTCLAGAPDTRAKDDSDDGLRLSRGAVKTCILPSGRRVVIRSARRGGMLSNFVRRYFLFSPGNDASSSRPLSELHVLNFLRANGCMVPKPVGASIYFHCFGLFYSGLVVTEELENSENLLTLGYRCKEGRLESTYFGELCFLAGREARRIAELGVLHTDLHLANVIVVPPDTLYLIDFDKARVYLPPDSPDRFHEKLIHRWARSAEKHGLSEFALEPFICGVMGEPRTAEKGEPRGPRDELERSGARGSVSS